MTSNSADVQKLLFELSVAAKTFEAVHSVGYREGMFNTNHAKLLNAAIKSLRQQADEIERLRAALQQSRSAALEAILNVRVLNAGNFERSGAVWEAYDKAVLDCHAAVSAALSPESAG